MPLELKKKKFNKCRRYNLRTFFPPVFLFIENNSLMILVGFTYHSKMPEEISIRNIIGHFPEARGKKERDMGVACLDWQRVFDGNFLISRHFAVKVPVKDQWEGWGWHYHVWRYLSRRGHVERGREWDKGKIQSLVTRSWCLVWKEVERERKWKEGGWKGQVVYKKDE